MAEAKKVDVTVENGDGDQGKHEVGGKDETMEVSMDNNNTTIQEQSGVEDENVESESPSSHDQDPQPRKRRKYTKLAFEDTLTGTYWSSSAANTAPPNPTENTNTSTRPKRANAGSIMKTALKEISRRSSSPVKSNRTMDGGRQRKSVKRYDDETDEEKGTPKLAAARASPKSPKLAKRNSRSVKRGPGRPRKSIDSEVIAPEQKVATAKSKSPSPKKSTDKNGSSPPEIKFAQSPTVNNEETKPDRRRSAGKQEVLQVSTEDDTFEDPIPARPPIVRTYSRKSKETTTATMPSPSSSSADISNITAQRVTRDMALAAVMSIPDDILPTSHEKFLQKFQKPQEKSKSALPTISRRVNNLKIVVSIPKKVEQTVKKSYELVKSVQKKGPSVSIKINSGELIRTAASTAAAAAATATTSNTSSLLSAQQIVSKDQFEDEKSTVVLLGNNQLQINGDLIILRDYSKYVKESEFEVPLDPDQIFSPEKKLDEPTEVISETATDSENSNSSTSNALPPPPTVPTPTDEQGNKLCKLEYCRLGCICTSLHARSLVREHCEKVDCMFKCTCLFKGDVMLNRDELNIRERLRPRVSLLNWKNKNDKRNNENVEAVRKPRNKIPKSNKRRHSDLDIPEKKSKQFHQVVHSLGLKKRITKIHPQLPLASKTAAVMNIKRARKRISQPTSTIGGQNIVQMPKLVYNSKFSKSKLTIPRMTTIPTLTSIREPPRPQRPPIPAYFSPQMRRVGIYTCEICPVKTVVLSQKLIDMNGVEIMNFNGRENGENFANGGPGASSRLRDQLIGTTKISSVIYRPNGTILTLLHWDTSTKSAPRFVADSFAAEINGLYLPKPRSGHEWRFYEVPFFPPHAQSVSLPEIGAIASYKIKYMIQEANTMKVAAKIYFQREDEAKLSCLGLPNFVYLIPGLPSLIVYGPILKNFQFNKRPLQLQNGNLENEANCSIRDGDSSFIEEDMDFVVEDVDIKPEIKIEVEEVVPEPQEAEMAGVQIEIPEFPELEAEEFEMLEDDEDDYAEDDELWEEVTTHEIPEPIGLNSDQEAMSWPVITNGGIDHETVQIYNHTNGDEAQEDEGEIDGQLVGGEDGGDNEEVIFVGACRRI